MPDVSSLISFQKSATKDWVFACSLNRIDNLLVFAFRQSMLNKFYFKIFLLPTRQKLTTFFLKLTFGITRQKKKNRKYLMKNNK